MSLANKNNPAMFFPPICIFVWQKHLQNLEDAGDELLMVADDVVSYPFSLNLTLSYPEALPWRVKSPAIRQSKITKGMVLAGLGEKVN